MEVLFLSPNTTAGLQARDMGVTTNMKVSYRRRVVDRMIFNTDRSKAQGEDVVPDLKVTPLMAVQFLYAAWYEVHRSTIRNCFVKVGFAPSAAQGDDAPDIKTVTEDETEFIDNESDATGSKPHTQTWWVMRHRWKAT